MRNFLLLLDMHKSNWILILFFGTLSLCSAQKNTADDSLMRAFFNDSLADGYSRNDYAESLENAFNVLNAAETGSSLNWQVMDAKERMMANRKILRTLRKALRSRTNSGFRDLQLYGNLLEDIRRSNQDISQVFEDAEEQIAISRARIRAIIRDSVLVQMVKESISDTARRRSRAAKLKSEYAYTSGKLSSSLDSLHRWRAIAAMQAISIAEMIQKTDSIRQQTGIRAFSGDCAYLWEAGSETAAADTAGSFMVNKDNNEIARYYVQKNSTRILWMPVVIFALFFRWIRRNYKRIRNQGYDIAGDVQLRYTRRSRVLLAIVASVSLFPLMDVYAPWFYLMLSQCIMMGALAWFFREGDTRRLLPVWLLLLALLPAISITNSFEAGLWQRCVLIGLNILSVIAGILLLPRIRYIPQFQRMVRFVTFAYIALNLLAILCNLFGRMIVAEALTNAGIFGLGQVITLCVFVEAVIEAFYLQLLASRIKRGIQPVFDYEPIATSSRKLFFMFSLLLWGTMFMANLYMYGMTRDALAMLMKRSVSLGSLSFTVGNMVLFFVIIWIAHLLQRYIGSFFGEADDDDLESKKQRSRMMITKLIVICLGYLLAVAASGLPLDKITIVLGALGVGVGMGLQNIVDNFVSGVVLIFDRPLQIGDSIEVGENSGKVKSIGLRSSTLLTADGAEVIIPNGDILSNPITNWTLSNNQRRLELEFTLQTSESKEELLNIIKAALVDAPGLVPDREPSFYAEEVKENEVKLKIHFWCSNTGKSEWIKSEVRYLLYGAFRDKGIVVI